MDQEPVLLERSPQSGHQPRPSWGQLERGTTLAIRKQALIAGRGEGARGLLGEGAKGLLSREYLEPQKVGSFQTHEDYSLVKETMYEKC